MGFLSLHTNTFKNGIHPPENKDDTRGLPIRQFPFATELIIPVTQHIGAPAEIIVREGQEVARGQMIAKAAGYVSVPIHSPISGIVEKIGLVPTISGSKAQGVTIKAFPSSGQEVAEGYCIDYKTASADEILQAIQDAGIVGLGGAAFPTHVKLKVPEGKVCDVTSSSMV
jgi:electron transport complex protein RnfC